MSKRASRAEGKGSIKPRGGTFQLLCGMERKPLGTREAMGNGFTHNTRAPPTMHSGSQRDRKHDHGLACRKPWVRSLELPKIYHGGACL